jgi:bifunctional non-homologous end joining protein LigD
VADDFPDWIVPMAATLTQERFAGPDWVFERKFDGIRLLAYKRGTDVRLYSRNRLPQNIPAIAAALAKLPADDLVLDGEVAWDGLAYHLFDIMWLNGRDLRSLPLEERRALLDTFPLKRPLTRVTRLEDPDPWERARREGWEGVIAKRRGSRYEGRRSPHWLKMKCEATQELVVGGFTDPQGGRVGLGALLVGYFEDGLARREFVFAGKVGTGFDTKLLLDLRRRLDALEIPEPPFTLASARGPSETPEGSAAQRRRASTSGAGAARAPIKGLPRLRAHWVRPEIVVQVAFIEWTAHGKLRHPRLIGVRFDKASGDVVRERA